MCSASFPFIFPLSFLEFLVPFYHHHKYTFKVTAFQSDLSLKSLY